MKSGSLAGPNERYIGRLLSAAADATGYGERSILDADRRPDICEVRFAIMYAARTCGRLPLPLIAAGLKRDHSTVLHGVRRAEELKDRPFFAALLQKLEGL